MNFNGQLLVIVMICKIKLKLILPVEFPTVQLSVTRDPSTMWFEYKAKAWLNETHHTRQPTGYRFLDSKLFLVNSNWFLWATLATE